MYVATGGPNVKWGAPISNGGPGTTVPPLATALRLSHWNLHLLSVWLALLLLYDVSYAIINEKLS